MMRAFRTEWAGIAGIVIAESASKARAITFRSANDAGFLGCKPHNVICHRMEQFDKLSQDENNHEKSLGYDYASDLLKGLE